MAGQWAGPPWLTELLLASLLINYFNLLPFMPLDGGRVLETLVFSRYPRLRFGFAAVCCGLLFALGSLADDLVLRVLALVLALALPHQWRLMRLDQAVLRDRTEALDEPQALRAIFAALQLDRFKAWSFARRNAATTALLPELQGRRARPGETVAGLLIYGVCLLGPAARRCASQGAGQPATGPCAATHPAFAGQSAGRPRQRAGGRKRFAATHRQPARPGRGCAHA